MIRLDGYILIDFDIIYAFEDGKAVPNTGDAHFFELIMS